MRIPNPIATTTTEAYLAYRAGFLAQADLKEKLYHPYLHIDGWLAYWTGLTDTYPTDKNGDPECLTDEEAYIAYLAGVTSEYPEALKDPADVRVASYLRYLISVRFGRPDYPVTREELYLSMMKPRFIPSGDPSSSIELDGTVEAPFVDVKMYGDSFQNTYSGKNLFNKDAAPLLDYGATHSVLPTGVRVTHNSSSVSNCFTRYIYDVQNYIGQTITLSATASASASNVPRIVIGTCDSSGGNRVEKSGDSGSGALSVSYTIASGDEYIYYQIYSNYGTGTGVQVGDYADYADVQLEVGSTATSYEPYTGGQPSPSPDYPQNINAVTGVQNVGVTGKNLWSSAWEQGGISTTTGGNFYTNTEVRTVDYIAVEPSQHYAISRSIANGSVKVRCYDQNKQYLGTGSTYWTYISGDDGNNDNPMRSNGTYCVIAPQTGVYYMRFTDTTNDTSTLYMMVKGDTTAPYEPYTSQSYNIDLGSIELCKIGDYQDYIYKGSDGWYLHKEITKRVFDGTENWTSTGVISNNRYFIINTEDGAFNEDSGIIALSDKFIGRFGSLNNSVMMSANQSTPGRMLIFWNDAGTTISAWKTWLGSNNTTVYYALADPTDTQITDENLIAQLDDLMEGGSYNDKTYITVSATDPNLPGLLYVEAAI